MSLRGVPCLVPYFFEEGRRTVTVTGSRYLDMLQEFFVPELQRRGIPLNKVWFQQDGASVHTTAVALKYLRDTFGTRLISKGASVPWPPIP